MKQVYINAAVNKHTHTRARARARRRGARRR